jgi:tmRNA-binding protein
MSVETRNAERDHDINERGTAGAKMRGWEVYLIIYNGPAKI